MINIGNVKISENVKNSFTEGFINEQLRIYQIEIEEVIKKKLNDEEIEESFLDYKLLHQKEIYENNILILCIETYKKDLETFVLQGEEYLQRESENFISNFRKNEIKLIRKSLDKVTNETASRYELKLSKRVIKLLNKMETIKNNL